MERIEALEKLGSRRPRERLDAARALEESAIETDLEPLERALHKESTSWIRASLEETIRRIRGELPPPAEVVARSGDLGNETESATLQRVTQMLVHELAPLVGAARLHAAGELLNDQSPTRKSLEQIRNLLEAFDSLGRAAGPPTISEIVVSDLVRDVTSSEDLPQEIEYQSAGPTELSLVTDPTLLSLILKNGLRNAAEATLQAGPPFTPVITTWGATDKDVWIAVLDRGIGLPLRVESAFQFGVSLKDGHLGVGLALVAQAAASLGASLSLERRRDGGARLQIQWELPRPDDS